MACSSCLRRAAMIRGRFNSSKSIQSTQSTQSNKLALNLNLQGDCSYSIQVLNDAKDYYNDLLKGEKNNKEKKKLLIIIYNLKEAIRYYDKEGDCLRFISKLGESVKLKLDELSKE